PDRVSVVPHAVNERFRPILLSERRSALARHRIERPYILSVGSIEPRKNLLRLLDAYAELRRWSRSYDLVIVGAAGLRASSVYDRARCLGLLPWIHFVGQVSDDDLAALYAGADVFVFPSIYEGFGLPALEAMASGVPVVASNASSLPEVTGGAAILVDPFNVGSIAAGIRRVLEDPRLASSLPAQASHPASLVTQ